MNVNEEKRLRAIIAKANPGADNRLFEQANPITFETLDELEKAVDGIIGTTVLAMEARDRAEQSREFSEKRAKIHTERADRLEVEVGELRARSITAETKLWAIKNALGLIPATTP